MFFTSTSAAEAEANPEAEQAGQGGPRAEAAAAAEEAAYAAAAGAAGVGAEDGSTTLKASGTPPAPAGTADLDLIYGRASIPNPALGLSHDLQPGKHLHERLGAR